VLRRPAPMQIRPHRLFLIGADTLAWDGLRAIVGRMPELQLVGEAFDPRGAVEAATAAEPDAVLLCSPLQRRSSSGLALELHRRRPETRVVVLAETVETDELLVYASARVAGYLLLHGLNAAAIQLCLRAVLEARLVVIAPEVARTAGEAWQMSVPSLPLQPPAALKEREHAVLRGLAAGLTREEIAAAEHLSLRTVERIVATLEAQFEAPSAFVLGMKAASLRLVS